VPVEVHGDRFTVGGDVTLVIQSSPSGSAQYYFAIGWNVDGSGSVDIPIGCESPDGQGYGHVTNVFAVATDEKTGTKTKALPVQVAFDPNTGPACGH
jgi:hypothetical protein